MNPTISVIIPVYNVEQYLSRCLDSVVGQTYRELQIICVNDGSTDGSLSVLRDYAERDTRIRIIDQPNAGLSMARNAGIAKATGEYVLFLDSDDYWREPALAEKLMDFLHHAPAEVLVFNYCKVSEAGEQMPYFIFRQSMEPCGIGELVKEGLWTASAWNKLILRELFNQADLSFLPGITSEDIDWCLRLGMAARSAAYLDYCGLCYWQRTESISASVTPQKADCLCSNIEHCVTLAEAAKREEFNPYIAYQVGTLLANLSALPKQACSELMNRAKPLCQYLRYSSNKKIRLLRCAVAVLGVSGTITLLRLRQNRKV